MKLRANAIFSFIRNEFFTHLNATREFVDYYDPERYRVTLQCENIFTSKHTHA